MRVDDLQQRARAMGWRGGVLRAGTLALGWWAISEGDPRGVTFGVLVVVLSIGVSLLLAEGRRPRWSATASVVLAAHFLAGSLRGGVDVARRAFMPRLVLSPAMLAHPLRLRPGPARDVFTSALSLMPGTLAVGVEGSTLTVHVLVDGARRGEEIAALEARVARALGEPLEDRHA